MISSQLVITALCLSIVIAMGYVVYCLCKSALDTKPYRMR